MPETQRRPVPLIDTSELETALTFLQFQREAIRIKCEGLSAAQLREVRVESGTNLIGLVQHLIVGERYWFLYHLAGQPGPEKWDFRMEVDPAVAPSEVLDEYVAVCAESDEHIRSIGDPSALMALPVHDTRLPMRWVLAHMTAETARHAGHADIIREQLDNTTGR